MIAALAAIVIRGVAGDVNSHVADVGRRRRPVERISERPANVARAVITTKAVLDVRERKRGRAGLRSAERHSLRALQVGLRTHELRAAVDGLKGAGHCGIAAGDARGQLESPS